MSTPRERVRVVTARLNAGVERLADTVNATVGTSGTFAFALLAIVLWALSGPALHFSDSWQLIINTSTTIITFLLCILNAISLNKQERNNDERKAHDEEQAERLERMETEHGQMLAELRDVLADLHSHTTCVGHTTIGDTPRRSLPAVLVEQQHQQKTIRKARVKA